MNNVQLYNIIMTLFANVRPGNPVRESCVCVTDVVDIEENIWSPRYFLSIQVTHLVE